VTNRQTEGKNIAVFRVTKIATVIGVLNIVTIVAEVIVPVVSCPATLYILLAQFVACSHCSGYWELIATGDIFLFFSFLFPLNYVFNIQQN